MAVTGELPKPDFKRGAKIYRQDIKKAASKSAEYNQELSTAYKEIKKGCHLVPDAARKVFKLAEMEDSKRDDWWRTAIGLAEELGCLPTTDLVDMAEAAGIPTVPKAETELATLN